MRRGLCIAVCSILMMQTCGGILHAAAAPVEVDTDHDGLSDRMEHLFGSDPANPDTDGDGYPDGLEVAAGYSPISASTDKLEKTIVITLSKQRLEQRLGGVTLASYPVSSGKPSTATPTGNYKILQKLPTRWSNHAKLWMPWWMMIEGTKVIGIHELPEYPDGRKEGANHLGRAVSGGCVRLGIGPAKTLYDWAATGTKVIVLH